MAEKNEIMYTIEEHIGIVASYSTGWNKELNLVSWNQNPAKYDLRDWDKDHQHMSRGITLHPEEMEMVVSLLQDRKFDKNEEGKIKEN